MTRLRIGLIVNPIAGMGGRVGLKGTDGADVLAEARRRGAAPQAGQRAQQALAEIARSGCPVAILTLAGAMGEDAAKAAGLAPEIIGGSPDPSAAADTAIAAQAMAERGVALILFAGGDGTARDIHAAIGQQVPLLGIPAGVKMHSGVFATSPAAAGRLVALLADAEAGGRLQFEAAEIMDIDEAAVRANRISARLYGYARIPIERRLVQQPKAGAVAHDDAGIAAAALAIAGEMRPDISYVVGPGRSAKQVLGALGLQGALLGVDLVRDGKLVGTDRAAEQLQRLTMATPVRIIAGVTGGQGFLFGRGNQQIPPEIIAKAGRDGLIVVAGRQKLAGLACGRLLVDTGDPALDAALAGHLRVRCGDGEWVMMRVVPA